DPRSRPRAAPRRLDVAGRRRAARGARLARGRPRERGDPRRVRPRDPRRRAALGRGVRGAGVSEFLSAGAGRLTWRRLVSVMAICLAATTLIAVLAPLLGTVSDRSGWHLDVLSPRALTGDAADHAILWVRLPRVLAALVVGAAFAGAGCALQALLRNPLAEPFTLGISS